MLEGLILGIIQGVTEWLPISSEGVLTLVSMKFFDKDLVSSVSMAVFLHLGTFLSALIYFRKDVSSLFRAESRGLLNFLILSTFVTGLIGAPLLFFGLDYFNKLSVNFILGIIGVFFVITGLVQFKKQEFKFRTILDVKTGDSIFAGIFQGLASVPGFSRSGLTIAVLLLRRFRETDALRLSFLMSLPAVLGGNILLNLVGWNIEINSTSIIALVFSFIAGFLTIGLLLKISRKINFSWFAIIFGLLTLISLLI